MFFVFFSSSSKHNLGYAITSTLTELCNALSDLEIKGNALNKYRKQCTEKEIEYNQIRPDEMFIICKKKLNIAKKPRKSKDILELVDKKYAQYDTLCELCETFLAENTHNQLHVVHNESNDASQIILSDGPKQENIFDTQTYSLGTGLAVVQDNIFDQDNHFVNHNRLAQDVEIVNVNKDQMLLDGRLVMIDGKNENVHYEKNIQESQIVTMSMNNGNKQNNDVRENGKEKIVLLYLSLKRKQMFQELKEFCTEINTYRKNKNAKEKFKSIVERYGHVRRKKLLQIFKGAAVQVKKYILDKKSNQKFKNFIERYLLKERGKEALKKNKEKIEISRPIINQKKSLFFTIKLCFAKQWKILTCGLFVVSLAFFSLKNINKKQNISCVKN